MPSPEQAIAWTEQHRLVQRQRTASHVLLLRATWVCDRVWNTNTGTAVNAVDTRSQVCALAWSRNVNELVACYGVPCQGTLPDFHALLLGLRARKQNSSKGGRHSYPKAPLDSHVITSCTWRRVLHQCD